MIDEEWLRGLRFEMPGGLKITELLGTGGTTIVFGAKTPDNKEVALRVDRQNLAWHLKEIPNFLTIKPTYDVNKLNNKLLRLVGEPYFEQMTGIYNKVLSAILNLIDQHGLDKLLKIAEGGSMAEAIPLFLLSSGLNLRLQEYATQRDDPSNLGPIDNRTAKKLLKDISALKIETFDLRPDILTSNPLYVWGAAVMDGLFTEEEFPIVAKFIETHFGKLSEHKNSNSFILQIGAVADFLAQVLQEKAVSRLVKLSKAIGFLLVVYDSEGKVVPGL